MANTKAYMSSKFAKAFLTIFLPFFLVVSLVYLVKISALTAKIQITFGELLLLYFYSIPDIIFYTLPISFIASLANMLIKLSTDNELIALYALGLKSKKILGRLILLGFLFSALLFTISFLGIPLSKQFYSSFKENKKTEAKLNISEGKLGQKFGDYYIYLQEKKDKDFHNIVIYNRTNKNDEQFFAAKKGNLNKKENQTSLLLTDGYGYTYSKDKLQQVKYDTFEVYEKAKKNRFQFETILEFWKKAKDDKRKMHKLLFYIFVSLIPLISVYLVAAFTMINPRYQSHNTFMVIFATVILFYGLATSLQKWGNITLLFTAIAFTTILGRWLFHIRVARFF